MVKPQADNPSVPDSAPTLVSETLPASTVCGDAETIQGHTSDAADIHLTGGMPSEPDRFREHPGGDATATSHDNPSVPPRPNVHGDD